MSSTGVDATSSGDNHVHIENVTANNLDRVLSLIRTTVSGVRVLSGSSSRLQQSQDDEEEAEEEEKEAEEAEKEEEKEPAAPTAEDKAEDKDLAKLMDKVSIQS